jgi:HlyD family secretion protein
MPSLKSSMLIVALIAGSLAVGAVGMKWWTPKPVAPASIVKIDDTLDTESDPADAAPVAATIHPKRDAGLTITVQNIATADPFFQTDLRARASGIVKSIAKDIGDRVDTGELLLAIDVPDLEQDVYQKQSLVVQRKQEVRVAEAKLDDVRAAIDVAKTMIRQRQAEVEASAATAELRGKRLARFRALAGRDAITPDIIEEQERDYQAATAALAGAKVAVEKAEADLKEKQTAIETAKAEVSLRVAMVDVAERDLDRARALADYARIRAPFAGTIVRRTVDPGDFVQNATTGASDTLISIARTDLITVVAKLPENVAPFLTRQTEATMEFDDLPGVTFTAHISRFSPAVQTSDRTVRVELDLFNDGQANYGKFIAKSLASALAPLGAASPLGQATLESAGREITRLDRKGAEDRLPPLPMITGSAAREPRLLPGMVGTVRLRLRRFTDACVIPATAVFSRGGKTYILVVRDGTTQLVPVVVQVSDGSVAKVAVAQKVPDGRGGNREVLAELTGNEEIVASRQLEFPPGKPVKTALTNW